MREDDGLGESMDKVITRPCESRQPSRCALQEFACENQRCHRELRKPKAKPDLLDFEVLKTLINSGGKVDGKRAKRPAISKYLTATTLCADEGVKLGTNTLEVLSDMINFSIEQNTHLLHMVDSINEDG